MMWASVSAGRLIGESGLLNGPRRGHGRRKAARRRPDGRWRPRDGDGMAEATRRGGSEGAGRRRPVVLTARKD